MAKKQPQARPTPSAAEKSGYYRTETDALGALKIPTHALYGIHTQRALENFPIARRPVHPRLIHAYGQVKLACARSNQDLNMWPEEKFKAIACACEEVATGLLDAHFLVDALQGGAGTSTNMNVNEVIANRALQLLDKSTGDYDLVHPIDDVNKHQSTNDTFPTALKIGSIFAVRDLEKSVIDLQEAFQRKEKAFAHVVKIGRTELQDAVLTTLGRSMSAYAEALGRDRWRIYKCEERLRVINLGGTAIGTGVGAPRKFIFSATERLREITGIGVARAENLIDVTQNTDVFVEVSGILCALASTLLKIANDLRLLSSGPDAGLDEIHLPAMQTGSSLMPGKVNPVIPESVAQASMAVLARHQALATAASLGNLELNAFMPLIADSLLENIDLLTGACTILAHKCVDGMEANLQRCRQHVEGATATATALVTLLGYQKTQTLIQNALHSKKTIRQQAIESGCLTAEQFDALISPESVMRLGQ